MINTHYQPHYHPTTKSLWLCSSVYCRPPHQSRRIWLVAAATNQKHHFQCIFVNQTLGHFLEVPLYYIAGRRTSLVVYGWWPQPPTKNIIFNVFLWTKPLVISLKYHYTKTSTNGVIDDQPVRVHVKSSCWSGTRPLIKRFNEYILRRNWTSLSHWINLVRAHNSNITYGFNTCNWLFTINHMYKTITVENYSILKMT